MEAAPFVIPCVRPRCCLRCLTLRGINMTATSLVPGPEVGGVVVLAGAALDLLFLGEEALQLGVGLLYHGTGVSRRLAVRRRRGAFLTLGPPAAATGGDDPPRLGRTQRLAHRHARLA